MDKKFIIALPEHIPEDRGAGKIKLSEFLTAVFSKDEIDADVGFFSTETDIGNGFFGSTIEGYEDECDQAYSIKDYCEALTAFEKIVAKKDRTSL